MSTLDQLNIGPQLAQINDQVAEAMKLIAARLPMCSEEQQDVASLILDAVNIRMAEMRSMLTLAAGNSMSVPSVLVPLNDAINAGITAAAQAIKEVPVDDHEARLHVALWTMQLDAARVAAINVLGHLGALHTTIERRRMGLRLVGGTAVL